MNWSLHDRWKKRPGETVCCFAATAMTRLHRADQKARDRTALEGLTNSCLPAPFGLFDQARNPKAFTLLSVKSASSALIKGMPYRKDIAATDEKQIATSLDLIAGLAGETFNMKVINDSIGNWSLRKGGSKIQVSENSSNKTVAIAGQRSK